jgi:hypothetical protein
MIEMESTVALAFVIARIPVRSELSDAVVQNVARRGVPEEFSMVARGEDGSSAKDT